ncbi:MAG: META domain-containing protein [bacterium]|nr:META domain-containing protein [bacterium]
MIKFIRIFLLVLIIVGLGLLVTQKMWVPKLVDRITSSENTPPVLVEATQSNISLKDGKQCFFYSHEATTAEPYNVTDFLTIEIAGNAVTGKKTGTQTGPGVSNGYQGSLVGTLEKNIITAILSYVVEGSQGKEKEIYKAGKIGIEKLRYPLLEESGMLVPDLKKGYQTLNYIKVDCPVENFEGEADPARMTLGMTKWNWVKTTLSDGRTITPKKPGVFTLEFKKDKTFSASTDCNGVGGEYVAKGGKITLERMMSTLMYCEGSQEAEFAKMLTDTQSYLFTSKGELVLNLKFDSGSVVFR